MSQLLRRPRALLLACGAFALVVAGGCSADTQDGDGDAVVTIYVSAPLSGPAAADGVSVEEGARLALIDAGGKASGETVEGVKAAGVGVQVVFLDDSKNDLEYDPATTAANARRASEDSSSVAYIGELGSGATRTSLPITNNAGILQVSPGSGASDLVRAESFNDDVPTEFQTTGKRTFARLVPSDELQGKAAAKLARSAPGSSALIISDGSSFGDELTEGFKEGFPSARLVPAPGPIAKASGCEKAVGAVDALAQARAPGRGPGRPVANPRVFLAAEPACSVRVLEAIGGDVDLSVTLIGSDALIDQALKPSIDVGEIRTTSAALDFHDLPKSGQEVDGRSKVAALKDQPSSPGLPGSGRYAAYGYEAMASILAAIDRSDDPTDRDSIIDAYLDGTERDSAIGRYSIDEIGETTLDRLSAYRISTSGILKSLSETISVSP